jgi:hypothetical protein
MVYRERVISQGPLQIRDRLTVSLMLLEEGLTYSKE